MGASMFKLYNHLLQDFFKYSSYMPVSLMPYYATRLNKNNIVWAYVYNGDNTQVLGYRVHTCWGDNKAVFCGNPESQDVHHVLYCHTNLDKHETSQHYELLLPTATVTTEELKAVSYTAVLQPTVYAACAPASA
jgi:hypothetical protein